MSDRDRQLAAMLGLCWHEWIDQDDEYGMGVVYSVCRHCGKRATHDAGNPDFYQPVWRARLMDYLYMDNHFWKWAESHKLTVQEVWESLPMIAYDYFHRYL